MVPSWPLLNPDRGASQSPHSHRAPWSAHQACCLEGLLQQGASSTDTDCRLRNVAVFSTLIHTGLYFAAGDLANSISCVAAAICRYPSSSLGNSLYQAWKQGCVSQKGFSSPSTLLTTFLPPICSSLPPSWPLCFLHMLAPRTSIFFLTFTYASLLMQWSCSLSFQLPPSIRKKCNPSSFL